MKFALRHFTSLLLAISIFALIVSCNKSTFDNITNSKQLVDNCRVIGHEFGETCVPRNPQRIVALDSHLTLDPLMALGIEPVGYTSDNVGRKEIVASITLDDLKGATNVGKSDQPSIEKVVMLKPDLILATKHHPYKLLSAIAPTVPVPDPNLEMPENEAFFKQNLRYVAKVFDKQTKAEEILNQYQQRIEQLQQRLGNQLKQIEVSVIYYIHGLVYTPAKNYDATADVLIDLGVRYKLPPPGAPISIESIEEYNTDILFIINLERQPLSFFLQHPIFSRLNSHQKQSSLSCASRKLGHQGYIRS